MDGLVTQTQGGGWKKMVSSTVGAGSLVCSAAGPLSLAPWTCCRTHADIIRRPRTPLRQARSTRSLLAAECSVLLAGAQSDVNASPLPVARLPLSTSVPSLRSNKVKMVRNMPFTCLHVRYANVVAGWRSQSSVSHPPSSVLVLILVLVPVPVPAPILTPTLQLSQARLVTSGWLVRTAVELESQHCRIRSRDCGPYRAHMERERRPRVQTQDAPARPILSKSKVRLHPPAL